MRAEFIGTNAANQGGGLPSPDDYAYGYEVGCYWAEGRGTWSEVRELVSRGHETWFHITLKADHSLLQFLSEEVWDCDPPKKRVKLLREPFNEGVVAGIVSTHEETRLSKGAAHRRE